jgi:hypothetical protein
MAERVNKMDALTLAVLRSHLLAEQCMGDYLVANGKKPSWIRKNRFATKMKRCKDFSKGENANELWRVLSAANQLRNTIAHTLSSEKIAEQLQLLKKLYFACLTEKQAADLAKQPDHYIAQSACVSCAGFIASLTVSGKSQAEQ